MVLAAAVEWSLGRGLDLMIDVWTTEALVTAVLGALLEEPENLAKALRMLQGGS